MAWLERLPLTTAEPKKIENQPKVSWALLFSL